jgi:holo-[acyl-carrier protein] synthase
MMTLRTGVDLIEIEQFEKAYRRHGDRFLVRIFTQQEILATDRNIQSLAARFAAKEAVSKALGTGIGDVSWHEIEILKGLASEPVLVLHGNAKRISQEAEIETWAISLSHTRALAIALVVATGSSCK